PNWQAVIARYTSGGAPDWTFGGRGYATFTAPGITHASYGAVARQSNGKIVVAGSCAGTDGADDLLIVRYNSNGTLDTSFGGGAGYVRLDDAAAPQSQEAIWGVAIQPDGKIVVGGTVTFADSSSDVLVAGLNANGTPDAAFGSGGIKLGDVP